MRTGVVPLVVCAVAWGALVPSSAAVAAPGDLDASGFGSGGIFTAPLQAGATGDGAELHHVALDAQGRTLLAFARDDDADARGDAVVVARLTEGGAVDSTFNPGGATPGLAEVDAGGTPTSTTDVQIRGVQPGPAGTILVLARVYDPGAPVRIVLMRLTATGQLDGDFGSGGRVTDLEVFGSYATDARTLSVDAQGRALVGGVTQDIPDFNGPTIKRYTTSGTLDPGWGTGGIATLPYGLQIMDTQALASGGLVASGRAGNDAFAARLTDAGAPDGTFSGDGVATVNLGQASGEVGWSQAVAADSQGRVVVGGYAFYAQFNAVAAVARFTAGGDVDGSFGSGAPLPGVSWLPGSFQAVRDLAVGCGDRVLAAGVSQVGFNSNIGLARLTAAGLADGDFGPSEPTPGLIVSDLGAGEFATGLASDAKGRAYVAAARNVFSPAADTRAIVMRRLDATGCAPGEQPPGPPPPTGEPPPAPSPPAGGGDAGPAGALAARFSGPARTSALSRVTLDARGSTGAAGYRWDVNGDGRDDVACGADQPLLSTRLASVTRSASTVVRLTAIGSDGARSTTSQTVAAASSTTAQRLANSVAQPLSCVSDRTSSVRVRVCTPETLNFGLVSAAGCFERVDGRAGVPRGELPILDAAIAYFNENQRRREYVVRMCTELRGRGCTIKQGEITRAAVDPLLEASDLRISRGMVKVNGLEFHPQNGATIAVFPQVGRVISSNAIVKFGDATVPIARQVNLDVEGSGPVSGNLYGGSGRVSIISFAPKVPFTDLAGFGLDGEVRLDLVRSSFDRYTEASFRLALPNEFSLFGGKPPSAAATMRADNSRAPELDDLEIGFPEANLGALELSDVRFRYTRRGGDGCPAKYWKATAQIYLGGGADRTGFRLAPDPPQNGIAFCQGEFKSAGGEFTFSRSTRPQIFPGVFLSAINFATQLKPTLLRGGVTITALDITEVEGALLAVFATPERPYTLTSGDAVGGLQPLGKLAGEKLQSTTFAAGGTFGFSLPAIGRVDFGSGYWLYAYPDYLALGGRVLIPAPGVVIRGGFDGEMSFGSGLYSFHGDAEACIAGGISSLGCIGGEAWVTSKGIVVCGSIAGEIHPGVGYKWGDTFPEIWTALPGDGCKPSGYWVDVPIAGSARAAQSGARTFKLKPGVRSLRVRIVGRGGAPDVELRGPDGETVSTAGAEYVRGAHINIVRHPAGGATWADIRNGRAGTYTVTPNAGSAAIASLATTEPAVTPKITARVSGKGIRRTLTYAIGATPRGQQVTFFERGGTSLKRIGTTTQGSGKLAFRPADGSGARKVTALVEAQGLRVAEPTVARYRISGSRPGRPGALRVKRRGNALTAAWGAAPGAARYGVVVSPAGGAQRILRLPAGRRSLRLTGTVAARGGTLRVAALDPRGAAGPSLTARWRPSTPPRSRFLPFRELRARR